LGGAAGQASGRVEVVGAIEAGGAGGRLECRGDGESGGIQARGRNDIAGKRLARSSDDVQGIIDDAQGAIGVQAVGEVSELLGGGGRREDRDADWVSS